LERRRPANLQFATGTAKTLDDAKTALKAEYESWKGGG
jgi:hypothetical protein